MDIAWKAEPFQWSAAFEIGVPAVDDEHRDILNRLNSLRALVATAARAEVEASLDDLVQTVRVHFDHEEHLMATHNYAGLTTHQASHANLLSTLELIREDLGRGEAMRAGDGLAEFFTVFFSSHVPIVDRRYVPVMAE